MSAITMPQLGESVTEGTIGRWLKNEGDFVAKDEPLVEIITDKVTAEMPSPVEGVLRKILVPEGQTVTVGTELAVVESKDDQPVASMREAAVLAAMPSAAEALREADEVVQVARQRSSPLVRRLAEQYGVDLSQIQGSGLSGRVTKDDVLRFVEQRRAAPVPAPEPARGAASASAEAAPGIPVAAQAPRVAAQPTEAIPRSTSETSQPTVQLREGEQLIEPSAMRKMIAEHMVRSKHTAPHATTVQEVDMSRIVRWREGIKQEFKRREGVDLTYLPFVVKATVEALKEIPIMNASWVDDKIILKKQINIGVAVALEDGLIVPVIRNADERSIAGLAKAINDLSTRARSNKLAVADVQGGTFTVNNTGTLGSIVSVPIIVQPQAAILAMEAIVKRPVVIDDAIAIRSMMYLCLSFDHRIVDGLTASRFLQRIKTWLEAFGPHVPVY